MANLRPLPKEREFDLARDSLRNLNMYLHKQAASEGVSQIQVRNPDGAHSIACGLDADLDVQIHGHVGYYVAGMNKHAAVTVHGNAGPGAAENMMSGRVHIRGFASTAAGASAHGGLLLIAGADARFEPMSDTDRAALKNLLAQSGLAHDPAEFKRVASAKSLYHWHADANQE